MTIEDRFHLGSDSKAFTSLLAGQFVEAGTAADEALRKLAAELYKVFFQ